MIDPIRLYLDEDSMRTGIVRALRARQVDVITAQDADLLGRHPDEKHLGWMETLQFGHDRIREAARRCQQERTAVGVSQWGAAERVREIVASGYDDRRRPLREPRLGDQDGSLVSIRTDNDSDRPAVGRCTDVRSRSIRRRTPHSEREPGEQSRNRHDCNQSTHKTNSLEWIT